MSLLLLLRAPAPAGGSGILAGSGIVSGSGTFQQATIATDALPVNVLFQQIGLTGVIGNVLDDPLTPDGLFMAGVPASAVDVRFGFPSPQGTLINGAGQQKFRFRAGRSV